MSFTVSSRKHAFILQVVPPEHLGMRIWKHASVLEEQGGMLISKGATQGYPISAVLRVIRKLGFQMENMLAVLRAQVEVVSVLPELLGLARGNQRLLATILLRFI